MDGVTCPVLGGGQVAQRIALLQAPIHFEQVTSLEGLDTSNLHRRLAAATGQTWGGINFQDQAGGTANQHCCK